MRSFGLVGVALCAISLTGCQGNAVTSVRVVNRTEATIEQVTVAFTNGGGTKKFGIIAAGAEAEITPAKPLVRPITASVRWVDDDAEESADVEVSKELAKTPGRGTVIFYIEPDHKVTIGHEQD